MKTKVLLKKTVTYKQIVVVEIDEGHNHERRAFIKAEMAGPRLDWGESIEEDAAYGALGAIPDYPEVTLED